MPTSRNIRITKNTIYVKDTRIMWQNAADMELWLSYSPYFNPWELDTDDFSLRVSIKFLRALNRIRERMGVPITATCCYRNTAHNNRVGGKPKTKTSVGSDHLYGKGADLVIKSRRFGEKLERIAIEEGCNAIGRYPSRNFIHIGMRKPKPSGKLYQWGRWFTRKVKHV